MRRLIFVIITCCFVNLVLAQQKEHKIVFDFTKGDTASFSLVVRQLNNIVKTGVPAKLEVVCYGPGLYILMTEKTSVKDKIEELTTRHNVVFAACEASMARQGITKSQLLSQATTVPLASLEISSKQLDGWSYLKVGY